MSGTVPQPATPTAAKTDAVVKAAQSLPDLVAGLQQADPALAQQIVGKSVLASKTIWGHVLLLLVSAAVTKWGINWDDQFQAEVAGAVMLGAQAGWGVVARFLTTTPLLGHGAASAPINNPTTTTGGTGAAGQTGATGT